MPVSNPPIDWEPPTVDEAERLYDVAHARAGNKQNISNISLIPYKDDAYEDLVKIVTADRVAEHFGGIVTGEVERYCVPSVSSMNFVLHGALDGRPEGRSSAGGRLVRSGKTLSQYFLRLPISE
jgi:hypothetical protein